MNTRELLRQNKRLWKALRDSDYLIRHLTTAKNYSNDYCADKEKHAHSQPMEAAVSETREWRVRRKDGLISGFKTRKKAEASYRWLRDHLPYQMAVLESRIVGPWLAESEEEKA